MAARRPRHLPLTAGVGMGLVAALVLLALVGPLLTGDPELQRLTARLDPPTWAGGHSGAWLGTDHLGRDVLARTIAGARVSLAVGLAAVALSGTVGVALGVLAGYLGGVVDGVLTWLADVQQAVPFLILAIAVAVVVGPGLATVVGVLALTTWVTYFRVVRSEVLALRHGPMVAAARLLGATPLHVMRRHVLPNVSASAVVVGSLMVGNLIVYEASLSFLGLGVPPPTPTWGHAIFDGLAYLDSAWWISLFPGLAILLAGLGVNLVGDWLRDVYDPRAL